MTLPAAIEHEDCQGPRDGLPGKGKLLRVFCKKCQLATAAFPPPPPPAAAGSVRWNSFVSVACLHSAPCHVCFSLFSLFMHDGRNPTHPSISVKGEICSPAPVSCSMLAWILSSRLFYTCRPCSSSLAERSAQISTLALFLPFEMCGFAFSIGGLTRRTVSKLWFTRSEHTIKLTLKFAVKYSDPAVKAIDQDSVEEQDDLEESSDYDALTTPSSVPTLSYTAASTVVSNAPPGIDIVSMESSHAAAEEDSTTSTPSIVSTMYSTEGSQVFEIYIVKETVSVGFEDTAPATTTVADAATSTGETKKTNYLHRRGHVDHVHGHHHLHRRGV